MSEGQLLFSFMTDAAAEQAKTAVSAVTGRRKKHYVENWDIDATYTSAQLRMMAKSISPCPDRLLRVIKELWP